jgi:hypothetical protein
VFWCEAVTVTRNSSTNWWDLISTVQRLAESNYNIGVDTNRLIEKPKSSAPGGFRSTTDEHGVPLDMPLVAEQSTGKPFLVLESVGVDCTEFLRQLGLASIIVCIFVVKSTMKYFMSVATRTGCC